MGAYSTVPYPTTDDAVAPNTTGGGAADFGFTGSAGVSINCTALSRLYVEIRAELASDGSNGSRYRYCWLTAAEAAASPAFATADVAATKIPAATNKLYRQVGAGVAVTEFVDPNRPVLRIQPYGTVSAAENILVTVVSPHNAT